jgi:hypothetical protein
LCCVRQKMGIWIIVRSKNGMFPISYIRSSWNVMTNEINPINSQAHQSATWRSLNEKSIQK